MKINHMHEFIQLVELRNFTRAADKTFISQSTFSKHIAELENELGCQLVVRTKHSVEPTDVGMKVYKYFKEITNRYDSLLHEIDLEKQGFSGKLRVGVLYYSLNTLLYPLFEQFREEYPSVDLKMVSLQPPQVLEQLEQGKIDIALTLHYEGVSKYPYEYIATPFFKDRLILAVHEGDALAEQKEVSLQDLNDRTVILMEDEPDYNEFVRSLLSDVKVRPKDYFSSLQIDTTFSDIRRKGGVMLLPQQMQQLHRDEIRFLDISEREYVMEMVYLTHREQSDPIIDLFTRKVHSIYR